VSESTIGSGAPCAAPLPKSKTGLRCTEPFDHVGPHRNKLDVENEGVFAQWPRGYNGPGSLSTSAVPRADTSTAPHLYTPDWRGHRVDVPYYRADDPAIVAALRLAAETDWEQAREDKAIADVVREMAADKYDMNGSRTSSTWADAILSYAKARCK
jgi:hypothetical protein